MSKRDFGEWGKGDSGLGFYNLDVFQSIAGIILFNAQNALSAAKRRSFKLAPQYY